MFSIFAAVTVLLLLLGCAGAPPRVIQYSPPELTCILANSSVDESSGVAASRRNPGIFWTHNDSGDGPRLYAFDREGNDWGTYEIEGVTARDCEDMALFTTGGRHYLLLADVGDNDSRHETCSLYIVEEPALSEKSPGTYPVPLAWKITFRYEDGPHDCEAVAVDVSHGLVLLITKNIYSPACKAYTLPLKPTAGDAPLTARAIAPLPLWAVTSADIAPDNRHLAVLSQLAVLEYVRLGHESWAAALARPPRTLSTLPVKQWEAISYASDGTSLLLTHEGIPTELWQLPARLER